MKGLTAIKGGAAQPLNHKLVLRGAVVAFVGPDGIGKSTTLSELKQQLSLSGACVSPVIRHWRPNLLPPLGRLKRVEGGDPAVARPPRRHPGRFQSLRLIYYWVDFVLGHLLRDRMETSRSNLVLYDRCALDMHVDPLRYGLGSTRGTRLLWRAIPKPDLVILLYDSPERILERKAELSGEELKRQLTLWTQLVINGEVDFVVRVNASPNEVAHRIGSLLEERLAVKEIGGFVPDDAARRTILDSVGRMLLGNSATLRLLSKNEAYTSSRCVAPFAVVPSAYNPRFLVSLGSRNAAANSLRTYSAHKPLARLQKWALSQGLRFGVAQPLLRHRTCILTSTTDDRGMEQTELLEEYLARVLGETKVFLSTSLGTPSVHQKPIFQVMNRKGRALAYAKVGWNEETIKIVRDEAATLKRLENTRFTTASVPHALLAEEWNGFYLLLLSAAPGEGWGPSRNIADRHLKFLADLHNNNHVSSSLGKSLWWKQIQRRLTSLDEMGADYDAHLARWTLDECADQLKGTDVALGFRHGDFAPWNVLERKGDLFVIDWEYAGDVAPAGSDLFHFMILSATLVKSKSPRNVARELLGRSSTHRILRKFFAARKIPDDLIPCFLALYAADILTWYLHRGRSRAGSGFGPLRDIWRHLLLGFVMRDSQDQLLDQAFDPLRTQGAPVSF